jgi:D-proline reductase (dithiol) PrdB
VEILENRDLWSAAFREGWLAHLERTGEIDWELYPLPDNVNPPAGPGIDLSAARLMFISTAGGYLPGEQEPFDAASPFGDYSVRLVGSSTPFDRLDYAHDHFDQTAIRQDPQVLVPLRHLEDLVAEGVIGELAPSMAFFMGYHPDMTRVIDETLPPILSAAQTEGVTAALLVPA